MQEELEAAIHELEAKLPSLRHLLLESSEVINTSPVALALAARLLRLTAMADETASNLRLALLGGNPTPPQAMPTMPLHVPEASAEPATVQETSGEGISGSEVFGEADQALLEIFGEEMNHEERAVETLKETPSSP